MPFADNAKNAMLDHLATLAVFVSLHTAWSATGTNEVTGGSPAYARKAITWNAASAGTMDSSAAPVFDVPASTTVEYKGYFSLVTGGTFYGMSPVGASNVNVVEGESTDNKLYARAHGYSNDDRVAFFGPNIPTGLTEGTLYHVVNATTDDFQVSTSQGGAAVTISAAGVAVASNGVPETFGGQGTFTLTDADIDLNLVT